MKTTCLVKREDGTTIEITASEIEEYSIKELDRETVDHKASWIDDLFFTTFPMDRCKYVVLKTGETVEILKVIFEEL